MKEDISVLTPMGSWFLQWHNWGYSNHRKPRVPCRMQWRYSPRKRSFLGIHFPNVECYLHQNRIH